MPLGYERTYSVSCEMEFPDRLPEFSEETERVQIIEAFGFELEPF